jgi:hypothetical protein
MSTIRVVCACRRKQDQNLGGWLTDPQDYEQRCSCVSALMSAPSSAAVAESAPSSAFSARRQCSHAVDKFPVATQSCAALASYSISTIATIAGGRPAIPDLSKKTPVHDEQTAAMVPPNVMSRQPRAQLQLLGYCQVIGSRCSDLGTADGPALSHPISRHQSTAIPG